MKITFEGASLAHIIDDMKAFISSLGAATVGGAKPTLVAEEPEPAPAAPPAAKEGSKRGRGRPPKTGPTPEEDANDESTGSFGASEVQAPEPQAEEEIDPFGEGPAEVQITFEDVKTAFKRLNEDPKKGLKAVRAVLAQLKCTTIKDLPENLYVKAIELCTNA